MSEVAGPATRLTRLEEKASDSRTLCGSPPLRVGSNEAVTEAETETFKPQRSQQILVELEALGKGHDRTMRFARCATPLRIFFRCFAGIS